MEFILNLHSQRHTFICFFYPLHSRFSSVNLVIMPWKPENHWSIKLTVNSPAMLFIRLCVLFRTSCFPTFAKCRFPLGAELWNKGVRQTAADADLLTFNARPPHCQPAPFSEILSLFNTSSLRPALLVTVQLPPQHSWVMTALHSFKHSLEEGSSRRSIRREAKPSMRQPICLHW